MQWDHSAKWHNSLPGNYGCKCVTQLPEFKKKKKKVQNQTNKRHLTKRFCILTLLLVGAGLACGPASLFTTTMVFMETCVHQGNYWHVDWLRTPNWHP